MEAETRIIQYTCPIYRVKLYEEDKKKDDHERAFISSECIRACCEGDLAAVIECVRRDPQCVHDVDRNDATTLMWSAGRGHVDICRYLVSEHALDPREARGRMGRTTLHWAARKNAIDVCKWLVSECGVDVNLPTMDGTTPLHLAAYTGSHELCRWFVEEAGADIHALNSFGCNSIQWCAMNGDVHLAKYLVEKGTTH